MNNIDVKEIREMLGLSQSELAEKIGVSSRTIQNWEAGRVIPKSKHEILRRLQSKHDGKSEKIEGITIPDATPQDLILAGAESFGTQIVKMMNDKLIAPYSLLAEKDKEIERLNREIGKLKAQLDASKKTDAQEGDNATCAVAK